MNLTSVEETQCVKQCSLESTPKRQILLQDQQKDGCKSQKQIQDLTMMWLLSKNVWLMSWCSQYAGFYFHYPMKSELTLDLHTNKIPSVAKMVDTHPVNLAYKTCFTKQLLTNFDFLWIYFFEYLFTKQDWSNVNGEYENFTRNIKNYLQKISISFLIDNLHHYRNNHKILLWKGLYRFFFTHTKKHCFYFHYFCSQKFIQFFFVT